MSLRCLSCLVRFEGDEPAVMVAAFNAHPCAQAKFSFRSGPLPLLPAVVAPATTTAGNPVLSIQATAVGVSPVSARSGRVCTASSSTAGAQS